MSADVARSHSPMENDVFHIDSGASCQMTILNENLSSTGTVLIRIVRFAPDLCANFLSVRQFDENGCRILDAKRELAATANLCNGMSQLNRDTDGKCFPAREADPFEYLSYHRRTGQPQRENFRRRRHKTACSHRLEVPIVWHAKPNRTFIVSLL